MKNKKGKNNNTNIKLIAGFIILIIVVFLVNNITNTKKAKTLASEYTVNFTENLYPGKEHKITINKDGEFRIKSKIKESVDSDYYEKNNTLQLSKENTKELTKLLEQYIVEDNSEITVDSAQIYDTTEKYLLESVIYNCTDCFNSEVSDYKYKIHYVIGLTTYYIYVLENDEIVTTTIEYNNLYDILNMYSQKTSIIKQTISEFIKLADKLFEDTDLKAQYVDSSNLTEEENKLILSVVYNQDLEVYEDYTN